MIDSTHKWLTKNKLVVVVIILIGLGSSLFSFLPQSDRHSVTEVIQSNIATNNSGPVSQNITINPQPGPITQVYVISTSSRQSDGFYHFRLGIGIGVVPGSKSPVLKFFDPPKGVKCGTLSHRDASMTVLGPLVGRVQYSWETDCVAARPVEEYNGVQHTINFDY